jgi:hypothetical protein
MSEEREITINVEKFGPDADLHEEISRALIDHPLIQEQLGGARSRLLSLEWVDSMALSERKTSRPVELRQLRATFYDYTNNRTLIATGPYDNLDQMEIEEYGVQPLPSSEEFESAVQVVMEDPELGRAIQERLLQPYRPMPPVVEAELPDGAVERVIAVGLLPVTEQLRHEIVGVNMIHQRLERYEHGAPPAALAHHEICNPPPGTDPSSARGLAGQVWVTVKQGRTTLWRFLAVRPSASSGIVGSGIELRFLNYRGKRVLYRGHVPILNVRYDNDTCGPYRDWQWEEARFQADGTDVASGFRLCPTPAKTILDTGNDTGNFQGVAIYVQGLEVVLVSEMRAGWYRYISEWRLHANGTIRPRFGFAGVANTCTCNQHHHHVYWRFDFDIRTASNNLVEEFNEPPLGSSNWHTKHYEIKRPNDPARKRRWRISNKSTGEGYTLIPGAHDGTADSFGVGDAWILRYRGSEIDDGQGFTTDPSKAKANLDKFLTGEVVDGRDVVVWYAAHFMHGPGQGGHILGPELTPSNW